MTTLYKKLSEFRKKYNHLIQESISNGEYMVCSYEMLDKYVMNPLGELTQIYEKFRFSELAESPALCFLELDISLKKLFDFIISLPVEQIERIISRIQLDMLFKEEIVESIKKQDFSAFKDVAMESRCDFEKLTKVLSLFYHKKNDISIIDRYQEETDSLDVVAKYQYCKNYISDTLRKLQLSILKLPSDYKLIKSFFENACSLAMNSFPCIELMSDDIDKWHSEELGYCWYLQAHILTFFFAGEDPFFLRMLWHPTTITYRLRWSLAIVQLPFSARILQEDFFLNPQNKNEDEYLTSVRPEFINAGLTPLVRFMELCPLVEYNPLFYRTFVYRITGRMRPDVERLPTKILLPESAPFIYYFIKGITIDNPDCPEDIYGKMKSFFSSVDFPEDENEIPEPCDAWKNAMLELYPEIFGDGNVQISESIGEKESQDIESEDTMRQSSPEKFEKLPDDFFTDPKYLNTEYPQYRILKDSVIEKGPGILTKVINKLITENMIDDSLETVSLLMSAISGRGLKHEYTSRIVVLNGREAGYAISRIVQLLCRRADYDSLKSQFEIKFKEDERHGKQQSYLKSFSVKENKGVIIVDLIKRLYTNDRLF